MIDYSIIPLHIKIDRLEHKRAYENYGTAKHKSLKKRNETILYLRDIEKMKYKDIAKKLKLTLQHVSRLYCEIKKNV